MVFLPASLRAASLEVSPISLTIPAPGAATTIHLRNVGDSPLNAQIRVFRWIQVNGEDKLEPTEDVIASPPATRLSGRSDQIVRVVRVTSRPISGEESYRLLVDEVPKPATRSRQAINLVLRYSIPVFFQAGRSPARVRWSIVHRGRHLYLWAFNDGDEHLRISKLVVRLSTSKAVSFGKGLLGYVLGHSSMRWPFPKSNERLASNKAVISAQSNRGPINAVAQIRNER